MRRLWHDVQAHKWAAALLLVYWLATLVVSFATWHHGIPDRVVVLLLTSPLVAGFLVGRWRAPTAEHAAHSRDRIGGGVLAGVLSAEITLLVMKGEVVEEVIVWMRGGARDSVKCWHSALLVVFLEPFLAWLVPRSP